jgi:hypothetical protein
MSDVDTKIGGLLGAARNETDLRETSVTLCNQRHSTYTHFPSWRFHSIPLNSNHTTPLGRRFDPYTVHSFPLRSSFDCNWSVTSGLALCL